jgi:hypothetical protein
VDPHSLDNGLGSEPVSMIRELKFASRMLTNSWQTVLGYYRIGRADTFLESCLSDLSLALDTATDEQFLQCRRLLLKEIGNLTERGSGPARKKSRQTVLHRTLEQVSQIWPNIVKPLGDER